MDVVRLYTGTLMTSLDMSGIQVSMLLLPKDHNIWLECLDTPTNAFGWPGNSLSTRSCVKREISVQRDTNLKVSYNGYINQTFYLKNNINNSVLLESYVT